MLNEAIFVSRQGPHLDVAALHITSVKKHFLSSWTFNIFQRTEFSDDLGIYY